MDNDLISRQAAIGYACSGLIRRIDDEDWIRVAEVRESLKEMPSAERRGRWEDVEHAPNGLLYATCSVCGKRQTVEAVNYCGNCGTRMEGEKE